jgi:hypothetical protein
MTDLGDEAHLRNRRRILLRCSMNFGARVEPDGAQACYRSRKAAVRKSRYCPRPASAREMTNR